MSPVPPALTQLARALALLALLALPALALLALPVAASAANSGSAEVAAQSGYATGTVATVLNTYATTGGPYTNGVWNTPDPSWGCDQGGPATAAATLFVLGGRRDPTLLSQAEQTIDQTIATRLGPNGLYLTRPGDLTSADGPETLFFGVELGTVFQLVAPNLPAAEVAKWQRALSATADHLISNKDLSWYANGNINLAVIEFMYLAWKATGNSAYLAGYQTALAFTQNPPGSRWPGRGLIITRAPTRPDGADGAGYLAEVGSAGPGYDPEYTELQLEVASRLYLLSGDPQILRLVNLLTNQLLLRVNTATMTLDTSGGSRHPQAGRTVNFLTPAFTVLSLFGGRTDLAGLAVAELQAERTAYTAQPWQLYNGVFRRSLGNDLSVSALAEALYAARGGRLANQTTAPITIGTPALDALGSTSRPVNELPKQIKLVIKAHRRTRAQLVRGRHRTRRAAPTTSTGHPRNAVSRTP